ncbi:hypothetical protein [Saccharothrix hoggarensis]|uniref:Uncharacterized protein n=1 Tax=Saccharothrix hoggarensis TaxID=913853 RepID=A0ABW3QSY7_9PSEU
MPNLRRVLVSVTLATTAFSATSLWTDGLAPTTPAGAETTVLASVSYQSGLFWPTGHRPV